MQIYYLCENGGITIENEKIHINIDKVVSIARDMMTEAIQVQLDNDYEKGKEYVEKYFQWADDMELIAQKKQVYLIPQLWQVLKLN